MISILKILMLDLMFIVLYEVVHGVRFPVAYAALIGIEMFLMIVILIKDSAVYFCPRSKISL